MAISYKKNLLFIHIPKNAGTSIIESLEMSPHGHYSWKNHPDFNNPNLYKFSIIRNPWDRVVSNYTFAKLESSFWHDNINKINNLQPHPEYNLLKDKSFCECVDMLLNNKYMFRHDGWGLQNSYVYDGSNLKVNRLLKMENLKNELNEMFDYLNLPIQNISHLNKSNEIDFRKFYTPDLIEKVAKIYQDDIKKFNYNFY